MMHIIQLIFDGYLLIFIFRRKGDLTLILSAREAKFFFLKKPNMLQYVYVGTRDV